MQKAFADAAGVIHPPAMIAPRIVCLVPSITELLCDLGLSPALVGRTGFCIHPKEVLRKVPKVGGTKDVDLDKVRALAPSHVIVNVDENRQETAIALAEFVPHVVVTHPLSPTDNLDLFRLIGHLFGVAAEAERLCAELESVLEVPKDALPHRRVLYLIWKDPWMTVSRDTYISRMLAHVNWWTEPVEAALRYPQVELPRIAQGIDEILLSSEPYPFQARHVADIQALCGTDRVRLIDGEMVSWYGSRAIQGLRYLDAFRQDAEETRT